MTHDEIINLIRAAVPTTGGTWADFGAGWGNFTRALRVLLGNDAVIYAVDRDAGGFDTLRRQHGERGILHTIRADFTQTLDLPPLDGAVMANALHFVRDQAGALRQVMRVLKPRARLILVEYDVTFPRPWIPYPVPFTRFVKLAAEVGLTNPVKIGERTSPSNGATMWTGYAEVR